jgi:hypothetical protein
MFVRNADPDDFWQLRQLQMIFLAGGPVSVKVTAPQRHAPLRVSDAEVDMVVSFPVG